MVPPDPLPDRISDLTSQGPLPALQAEIAASQRAWAPRRPKSHRRRTFSRWRHRVRRRWKETQCIARIVVSELIRTRVIDVGAGLAFWSMMSMIPLLMTVGALLSLLRLPDLFSQLLAVLAMIVPPSALSMVEKMVGNLLKPHTVVLSFGILSYIWSTTSGFTALISALNIAYDVQVPRSWLRDRLQAILLTFTSGGLLTISLLALIAGPHVVHFLGQVAPIPHFLERMWPSIRYGTVAVAFVLALEIIYFLGPNMRQRFTSTLPGALFAIALWFAGSFALAFYLDHLAHYSRLYGGMGAVIALMFWIYLTALVTLMGAELNAEIAKRRDSLFRGHLKATWKQASSGGTKPRQGREAAGRPAA